MAAIETSVEVSECQITPTAYGADTERPWVNIELVHERYGPAVALHLSIASENELDRLVYACEVARSFFEREADDLDGAPSDPETHCVHCGHGDAVHGGRKCRVVDCVCVRFDAMAVTS